MTPQSIQTPPAGPQVFRTRSGAAISSAGQSGQFNEHSIRCNAPDGAVDWLQFQKPELYFWRRYDLPIDNLPSALAGARLVHLSDFHLERQWSSGYDDLLNRLARDPPDLLLATGDYVDDKHDCRPAIPLVRRLIAGLRARSGCFGIFGNHDTDRLAPHLRDTQLQMIGGQRRIVALRGSTVELIGLPDVQRCRLRPAFVRSMPSRSPGRPRIVLSHFPDHWPRTRALAPDIFLCGHTHGGQVCLPGGLPIIRHAPMPRRLCGGIHRLERTWYVVNRGFGFSGPPLRLFCPPEVVELVLQRRRQN